MPAALFPPLLSEEKLPSNLDLAFLHLLIIRIFRHAQPPNEALDCYLVEIREHLD